MNRNSGIKMYLLAASTLGLIAIAGCDRSGPAETAGRQIDQTMEKMGKQVDQATNSAKEQASKAGQVIDDTAITAAVKAGILAEPGLKVLKIDVDTKDGLVMLTGSADSAENVQKATQVANGVQGVKSVDNRLAVSSKG
jgi:hyperosmotically inducible protein